MVRFTIHPARVASLNHCNIPSKERRVQRWRKICATVTACIARTERTFYDVYIVERAGPAKWMDGDFTGEARTAIHCSV